MEHHPGRTARLLREALLEELLCGVGLRARNPELLAELPTQVLREPDQDGHRDHHTTTTRRRCCAVHVPTRYSHPVTSISAAMRPRCPRSRAPCETLCLGQYSDTVCPASLPS